MLILKQFSLDLVRPQVLDVLYYIVVQSSFDGSDTFVSLNTSEFTISFCIKTATVWTLFLTSLHSFVDKPSFMPTIA